MRGYARQAYATQDIDLQIEDASLTVIGASQEVPETLTSFRAEHGLGFILAGDLEHKAAEVYGAREEKPMYGKEYAGVLRSHVAIKQEGGRVASSRRGDTSS